MIYMLQFVALLALIFISMVHGSALQPAGEVILGVYTLVNGVLIALSWKSSKNQSASKTR